MSNLIYPANLPGLKFDNTRSPVFNTGVQAALSGKESRIAYQQYPLMEFEMQYELLRDYTVPSDLKALTGLFIACQGKYDTFLFSDPAFNTVSAFQFGTGDGVTTAFQITAAYQNTGGPGGVELIQNFNGTPFIFKSGTLQVNPTNYTLGATGIVTFVSAPAAAAPLTWSGAFLYRCRFDDDSFTVTQFLSNFWENKRVKIRQVKL